MSVNYSLIKLEKKKKKKKKKKKGSGWQALFPSMDRRGVWTAEEPKPAEPRLLLVLALCLSSRCFQIEKGAWKSHFFLS